jgi:flavin reductase (DIM6/NTAB) family NADH-FMN oxidoreductase RutF
MASWRSDFEHLAGRLDYPMLVVTAADGEERSGCLVGFSTQCSIDPARYWIGISVNNRTHEVASRATHLAIHTLRPDQRPLAELFGTVSGYDVDKFERCRWHDGPQGTAILDDAAGWFVGRVHEVISGGDHTWFMVEPEDAMDRGQGRVLSFQDVKDLDAGREA